MFLRLSLAVLAALSGTAFAQNAAGVFGPKVPDDFSYFEYRYSVIDPADGLGTAWAQRVHYEHAIHPRVAIRGGVQWRDRTGDDQEFDFARVMVFWEAGKLTENWTTGFRFDGRVRNGGRADDVAVSWTNQVDLGPRSFTRFNLMAFIPVGGEPSEPTAEFRGSYYRRLESGHSLGLELYNVFGEIGDPASFDQQRRELAPSVQWAIPGPYTLFTSWSFGLTDNTPSDQFRLRIGRRF